MGYNIHYGVWLPVSHYIKRYNRPPIPAINQTAIRVVVDISLITKTSTYPDVQMMQTYYDRLGKYVTVGADSQVSISSGSIVV